MPTNAELYDLFAQDPAACFTDLKDPTVPSSLEDMVPPPYRIYVFADTDSKHYTPTFTDRERLSFYNEVDHRRLNGLTVRDLFENWHFDFIIKTGTKPPLIQERARMWIVAREFLDVIKEYSDTETFEYFLVKVGISTKKGDRLTDDADYYVFNMLKHCFTYHPYTDTFGPDSLVESGARKYDAPLYAGWSYNLEPHWHYYDFRSLDIWCIPCDNKNH